MGVTTRRDFVRSAALAAAGLGGTTASVPETAHNAAPEESATTALDPEALRKFAGSFRGQVMVGGAPEYESSRRVFKMRLTCWGT